MISLFAGGDVSGAVTDATRVICPADQEEPEDELTVGAEVREADLKVKAGGVVYKLVKLG
ncbi:MAG: hypothetical protein EXQ70_08700 [Solirubrobacterales bacterium]|nr:hypothetical protein [Solirubrobacterales bacterium]